MSLKVDGTNGVLQAYDLQILTTGFTYTFAAGTQTLIIGPAGTLATGTVTMPASPVDGMVITIISTQPITTLTVAANTGQAINNGGSKGLQAGGSLSYVWNLANARWQPFSAALPLGVGQAWTDVTASRALSTTYTNTTGKPIQFIVGGNTSNGALIITVGGITLPQTWATTTSVPVASASAIVPAGATYSCAAQATVTLSQWRELR